VDISDEEVLQDTFQREDIADLIGALSAQPGVNLEISRGIIISPGNLKVFIRNPAEKISSTLSMFIDSAKAGRWFYS